MEGDGYMRDLRNRMICAYRVVITTAISGVGLLGLHSEKSTVVHNWLR